MVSFLRFLTFRVSGSLGLAKNSKFWEPQAGESGGNSSSRKRQMWSFSRWRLDFSRNVQCKAQLFPRNDSAVVTLVFFLTNICSYHVHVCSLISPRVISSTNYKINVPTGILGNVLFLQIVDPAQAFNQISLQRDIKGPWIVKVRRRSPGNLVK